MLRYATAAVSALLFGLAGFFLWKSQAAQEDRAMAQPTARDLMTRDVVSVPPETPVLAVARLLAERGIYFRLFELQYQSENREAPAAAD